MTSIVKSEHRELAWNVVHHCQKQVNSATVVFGNDASLIVQVLEKEYNVAAFASSFDGCLKLQPNVTGVLLDSVLCNLKEETVRPLLANLAEGISSGGLLFIREDLSKCSSALSISQLTQLFDSYQTTPDVVGKALGFELVGAFPLSSSIYTKLSWHDVLWVLRQKTFENITSGPLLSFRDFLDKQQYSSYGILAYEWIFGEGFISPGGSLQNRAFVEQIGLQPGQTVLDVGSGIGGNAFQMAQEFGVHVIGVDLSSNMQQIATRRADSLKDTRVKFVIVDVTAFDFPEASFDVVYSRDCIIHINDKRSLFARFLKWLKPGGKFQITDYNVGEKEFTPEFKDYLANRQYSLWPISKYVQTLKDVGFQSVEGLDITNEFSQTLSVEMSFAESNKAEFCEKFSEEKYDHLLDGWKNKLGYIASGDQKWGLFKARKLF